MNGIDQLSIIIIVIWVVYWYLFLTKANFSYGEYERNTIKHSIIRKTFTGLLKFLLLGVIYSFIFDSSNGASKAGGGGDEGWSDKFAHKCSNFYNNRFPQNPNITINAILVLFIILSFPFFAQTFNNNDPHKKFLSLSLFVPPIATIIVRMMIKFMK